LNLACQSALTLHADHVTDLYISIGPLSDIAPESVQFYFESISRETICAGAQLHFEPAPIKMKCGDCGSVLTSNEIMVMCSICGSEQLEVLEGCEVRLDHIQAEEKQQLARSLN
jgi:hydrogenase nickel incorporation protein HypA/HybF